MGITFPINAPVDSVIKILAYSGRANPNVSGPLYGSNVLTPFVPAGSDAKCEAICCWL